jgi:uroporphyrinogen decarboxylase
MVRAARGERVERPPAWMMRQAGRYQKAYRDLAKRHPSFRDRSETTDLIVEISLQPWHSFKPDGVILFSDILTPLNACGISFEIDDNVGPLIDTPIIDMDGLKTLHPIELDRLTFVGDALGLIRSEVRNTGAAVLGFVGSPWTLATYVVEGKSTNVYKIIKTMMFLAPDLLDGILSHLAVQIAEYACYQIVSGAHYIQARYLLTICTVDIRPEHRITKPNHMLAVCLASALCAYASATTHLLHIFLHIPEDAMRARHVQIFDSWGGQLPPHVWDKWSRPYIEQIISFVKLRHPTTPIMLYANGSGGLIERMGATGADVIGLDWTIDMADARKRLGTDQAVQGNLDPAVLFADKATIGAAVADIVSKAGRTGHVLNLGHGVLVGTPEENVKHVFDLSKQALYVE